jgi:hypothetical protein
MKQSSSKKIKRFGVQHANLPAAPIVKGCSSLKNQRLEGYAPFVIRRHSNPNRRYYDQKNQSF